jgi:hypothetical protein
VGEEAGEVGVVDREEFDARLQPDISKTKRTTEIRSKTAVLFITLPPDRL